MSADFTPSLNTYTDLTPFRFWCQKILPIAYDDSLSYYELLCKVVDYLNKTMEDVELSIEDVEKLHDAYVDLQEYVNDYFTNLDVQEEINNKLDALVADGTIHDIFSDDVMAILTQAQAATQQAINNIPNVVSTWLGQHVTQETGYVIDDSLSTKNAAADALATGVADSNIKSAVELAFFGEIEDDDFVQGYRTQADYYTVHNQTTRCCSAKYYHVYPGDTISISNIADGTKSAILGTGKTSATNYDSGWKTADFTYTAVNELIVFVEVAKSDDTADILVSDVSTVFTLVDKSTRITGAENKIGELKSDLDDLAFGIFEAKSKSGKVVEITDGILTANITSDALDLTIEHTGKNLIYTPFYYSGDRTVNGITYTFNNDGTINVNGTATANASTDILDTSSAARKPIKAGIYTFSDGSEFTEGQGYYTLIVTGVGQYYLSGTGNPSTWSTGITFTCAEDTTYALQYRVSSGNTVNNVTLKPQLELGTAKTAWNKHVTEQITLTDGEGKCPLFTGTNVLSASSTFSVEYCTANKPNSGVFNLKEMGVLGDGVTDDTTAINNALETAAGNTIFIPEGTYLFSGTLTVKSGTKLIGCGSDSVFQLANSYSLTPYEWRTDTGGQYAYRYPMITTEADSEGCIFENFAIVGQSNAFVDENEDGIALRGSQHIARNLNVTKINYFPASFSGRSSITPGWGITVIDASTVSVENCVVDECGYECIGIEDAETVTIDSCSTGVGNQTSVQIHRNSTYCRIINNTMNKTSSCMTMDADPLTPMANIYIANNYIRGVLNFVAGGENNIFVENNTIGAGVSCNNTEYRDTLFLRGNKIGGRVGTYHDNAIITDNIINISTGYYMIIHHGNKSVIANNLGIGSVTDIYTQTHE